MARQIDLDVLDPGALDELPPIDELPVVVSVSAPAPASAPASPRRSTVVQPRSFPPGFDPMRCFPGTKTPRPAQIDAIKRCFEAFQSGKKFVVLEAPPGSGKSLVAATLAAVFGRTFICTLTKSLQAQYVTDPDLKSLNPVELKGRSAYRCARCADSCEIGVHQFKGVHACNPCTYKSAKERALMAGVTVCNYHSFLSSIVGRAATTEAPPRALLVLDESHGAENVLMAYASVAIREAKLVVPPHAPLPVTDDIDDYWTWLEGYRAWVALRHEEGLDDPHDEAKVEYLMQSIDRVFWAADKSDNFVLERDDDGKGFALRPVRSSGFGGLFFNRAERVLLMSGTILDFGAFCRSLGINQTEAVYITEPCTFPAKNRLLIVGNMDMRYDARFKGGDPNSREGSWPEMLLAVQLILNTHANEKGLLLTPSNAMIDFLRRRLAPEHSRRLVIAFGEDREAKLQQHLVSRVPTVLTASGMWEGVDLKGDDSRFQIIPQLPRPALTPQVRARMDVDGGWYDYRTMCRFVQGYGRSTRSETDFSVTYCLDRELRRHLERRVGGLIPQWVREAVVYSHGRRAG